MSVDAVVTGNIGHKAFSTLDAGEVKVYVGASGSVKNAVEQWRAGELGHATGMRFERHWVGLQYQGVS
jgi:predicted Fe-Mo cluster-binding NifX family protein